MSHAERILTVLDSGLDHAVQLVIYGRSALALGFSDPPAATKVSLDVDAIIPVSMVERMQSDTGFWEAQENANRILEPEGLYITHLFQSDQVFLRRDWESHLLPILRPETRWLRLFRPATLDLILSKMMRGDDPQDMEDVDFMIRHDRIPVGLVEEAMRQVVLPNLIELRDAFEVARPRVLELAKAAGF